MVGTWWRASRKLLIVLWIVCRSHPTNRSRQAKPAMSDAAFLFAAVGRKGVTAGFDGRRLTPGGGVMPLAAAERRLEVAGRLAGLIADPRNPLFVTHGATDILCARMLVIACSYRRRYRSSSRWKSAPRPLLRREPVSWGSADSRLPACREHASALRSTSTAAGSDIGRRVADAGGHAVSSVSMAARLRRNMEVGWAKLS